MKILKYILITIGVIYSLLAVETIYVGVFASEDVLSKYPLGTELGWGYRNKTNYMMYGIIHALISWAPFLVLCAIQPLTRPSTDPR